MLDLSARAAELHEDMDALDGDLHALHNTYAHFPTINAILSGWWWNYRHHIRPHLSASKTTTLLDVGCGGGDITRNLVKWANRDGLRLDTTGIDTDPRAIDYALNLPPLAGARYRNVSSHQLVKDGEQYDLVISNHMLHHLSDEEVPAMLDDFRRLSRHAVVVSDLRRSRLSYMVFKHCVAPFFPKNAFIRQDGLTSIRKAFTGKELCALLPAGWLCESQFSYRYLVRYVHA